MPGVTKERIAEIERAAASLVSAIGIENIDQLTGNARKAQMVALAKQLQADTGVAWNTARQHVAKACRRARGKLAEESSEWGGKRPGAGRIAAAMKAADELTDRGRNEP